MLRVVEDDLNLTPVVPLSILSDYSSSILCLFLQLSPNLLGATGNSKDKFFKSLGSRE